MAVKVYLDDVTLEDHSVTLDASIVAGFLARDYCSRKELGYVWTLHGVWCWRSMTGNHYGERQKKRAAVETLRDAWRLSRGASASTSSSSLTTPRREDAGTRHALQPTGQPTAPVKSPVRQVVWGDNATAIPDLRNAIANAFARHQGDR